MNKITINKKILTLISLVFVFVFVTFIPKLTGTNTTNNLLAENISPFYPELPEKYKKIINENENSIYSSAIEYPACRELIIIKNAPEKKDRTVNFDVEIFFNNQKKTSKLDNDAALYRYHHKLYAIFKKHLPFVDIEKITIKMGKWRDTLVQPFSPLGQPDFKYVPLQYAGDQQKPNPYIPLFVTALNSHKIKHIPYSYELKYQKLFQVFYDLDSYIKNKNTTLGTLADFEHLKKLINKNPDVKISFKGKNKDKANRLIKQYINGEKELDEVFNVQKLADFLALKDLFSISQNEKTGLIYEKETGRLSPFFTGSKSAGDLKTHIKDPKINNEIFLSSYIKSLQEISEIDIDKLIENTKDFKKELIFINRYEPDEIFDEDVLKIKQGVIKKSLDAQKMLITELISFDKNFIKLRIKNFSDFPLQISRLKYKNKNIINFNHTVKANKIDTITGQLPGNFENLFVKKKSKNTGFKLYKDIYKMYLTYHLFSLDKNYRSEIIPYTQEEKLEKEDLFREPIELKKYDFLNIDTGNRIISLKNKKLTLRQVLRIPKTYTFKLTAGNEIDIRNGGKIISFAPLSFEGEPQKPIRIYSGDDKGQGLVVFAEGKKSILKHVVFDRLSNPVHGYWNVSGAITFYESPVELYHVSFLNNASEDALNIVRTSFAMNHCTFKNTQSDAFDGDFVTGELNNCTFVNSGNDAVDVSGSKISLDQITIDKTGDKGLSAGERSIMKVKNLTILNSEIGVASKDLSTIIIDYVVMKNTKLAFTAFQKKPEFGPSKIIVKKAGLENIEKLHLIENRSVLSIEGKEVETIQNVKSKMYGVEFGVSSKVTRNKKRNQ